MAKILYYPNTSRRIGEESESGIHRVIRTENLADFADALDLCIEEGYELVGPPFPTGARNDATAIFYHVDSLEKGKGK